MQKKLLTRLALAALSLTVAMVLARVVLREGLVRPVRVASGSMAETLAGEHYRVTCAECGMPFRCDHEPPPPGMQAVCPNCGFRENAVGAAQLREGQRVLIDHLLCSNVPRRWAMVAFVSPDAPDQFVVKRLVGLPGERVATREGDLWIDGRIACKDLAQQREVAVLVHDDGFRPPASAGLPPRWQGDASDTRWQSREAGFTFTPPSTAAGNEAKRGDRATDPPPVDWLSYRHWRCVASPFPRTEETPVRDNYGYNQALSRQLYVVTDLMLVCRLSLSGQGRLVLRASPGRDVLEVVIHPAKGRLVLLRNAMELAAAAWPRRFNGQGVEVVFSLFDQQAILAADGEVLLERALEPSDRPLAPVSRPFAIGAEGVQVAVEGLQIYRDLYYLDPHGFDVPWELQRPLRGDEFFVLGDNVPISRDSRTWRPPLKRDALTGVVTAF